MDFDLDGTHLVEASAGTGKTYSLSLIVLRLVIEGPQALDMRRLAVVTFTEAAAGEIADRVRQVLRSALALDPLPPVLPDEADEVLRRLWTAQGGRGGPLDRPLRARLERALMDLDLARIGTIHSFCRGLLETWAFEAGQGFRREVEIDQADLTEEILQDFWRQRIQALDPELLTLVNPEKLSPEALREALRGLDNFPHVPVRGSPLDPGLAQRLPDLLDRFRQTMDRSEEPLGQWMDRLGPNLSQVYWKAKGTQEFWDSWQAFASGLDTEPGDKLVGRLVDPKPWKPTGKSSLPGPNFPSWSELLAVAQEWTEARTSLETLQASILAEAWNWVRKERKRRQDQAGTCSANDLITDLHQALVQGGEGFAQRVRRDFQAVMVDEFQDTDPTQFDIFHRLFAHRPGIFLGLIGDPKQAIYRFRGGDVEAYLAARRGIAVEARHSLDTNWRTDPSLLAAMNAVFTHGDRQTREAGLAGGLHGLFREEGIEFHPVKAGVTADRFRLRDAPDAPVLTVWQTADQKSVKVAAVARRLVTEIRRLLRRGTWATKEGDRPLAPGDMAILVSNHGSAQFLKAWLAREGIPSVTGKGESLFASREARDILTLLAAVADPQDEGLRRAALLSSIFAWDARRLEAYASDPALAQEVVELQVAAGERWISHGVVRALEDLFDRLGYLQPPGDPRRLLGHYRRATNTRHILEILHGEEGRLGRDRAKLLARLGDLVLHDRSVEQRMESDEAAVTIMTMHKSKGLQWPVVFAVDLSKQVYKGGRVVPILRTPGEDPVISFASGDQKAIRDQDAEALEKEKVRLAYVAMTRAEACLYVVANRPGEKDGVSTLANPAQILFHGLPALPRVAVEALEEAGEALDSGSETPPDSLVREGRRPREWTAGPITPRWRIASYSALTRGIHHSQALPPGARDGNDEVPAAVRDFPRGAGPGTVLHKIFEKLDFVDVAETLARGERTSLRASWARTLAAAGLDAEARPDLVDGVEAMVEAVLSSPLALPQAAPDEAPFRLGDLRGDERRGEMTFMLGQRSVAAVDSRELVRALDPVPARVDPKAGGLAGYLTGAVDLVFRARGRWYILDWKSNWLGARRTDYAPEALDRAMDAQNYHLQYHLYSLALHRYLRQSQVGYDYETHFGGVLYLFLRGVDSQGNGVFRARPQQSAIDALEVIL